MGIGRAPVGAGVNPRAISGAATSVIAMCWVTRAENSATLRLQRGETNASERRSQPERQAARSVLGAPRDFANAKFAKAKMSRALMRTGSSFQWSAPGTGAAPQ